MIQILETIRESAVHCLVSDSSSKQKSNDFVVLRGLLAVLSSRLGEIHEYGNHIISTKASEHEDKISAGLGGK